MLVNVPNIELQTCIIKIFLFHSNPFCKLLLFLIIQEKCLQVHTVVTSSLCAVGLLVSSTDGKPSHCRCLDDNYKIQQ